MRTIGLLLACRFLTVNCTLGLEIGYEDLKGARRRMPSCWEIGFGGRYLWKEIEPIRDSIEGLAYVKAGKWNQEILPLPNLHITADLHCIGAGKLKDEAGKEVPFAEKLEHLRMLGTDRIDSDRNGEYLLSSTMPAQGMGIIPATQAAGDGERLQRRIEFVAHAGALREARGVQVDAEGRDPRAGPVRLWSAESL